MAAVEGSRVTGIEFFCETLAKAEGDKFAPEKYASNLSGLLTAAKGDPDIKVVVVLCRGDEVVMFGVSDGKPVEDKPGINRILLPLITRR